MRKSQVAVSTCLAIVLACLATQSPAIAKIEVRDGQTQGTKDTNQYNAVETEGDDNGGHNNGSPRVQEYKGTVRKSRRSGTPAPEQSGMPVYASPCEMPGAVPVTTKPKVQTVAYVRPAQAVAPEPSQTPALDTLEFNPQAVPAVYWAVCTFPQANPQAPNPKDQADVLDWVKAYFSQTPMPVPEPEISAPNGGICGVTHTIDLHMNTEAIYNEADTPFGDLTLHVYGRVLMNWGDGKRNVYTTGGAPYPNSDIKHVWTTKGTYDVTSHVDWIANFTIGPYNGVDYSGVLSGIATDGGIDNFQMWDAQAMITK